MKGIFSENTVIENLIVYYFMQDEYHILTNEVVDIINEFLQFYKMKDEISEAHNLDFIKTIYSINKYETKAELLERLNISESALFRFRNKIVKGLSKHIHSIKKSVSTLKII